MKQILRFSFALACFIIFSNASAQFRYESEIFTNADVVVHSNVPYGQNYNFLINPTMPDTIPLVMDVYEPDQTVDTKTERPVMVYIHTGNFLPVGINGSVSGTKTDSVVVEMCRQWARRGFVAISCDYRLGWNPVSMDPNVRRGTLLNAVYRALNDVRSCVRNLKRDYTMGGNTWGIDTNNIVLYGQGSGGYVSLAYSTLDKYSELAVAGKFGDGTNSFFIDTAIVGNVDGRGGALNLPNHASYSDRVSMVVNAGGALADTSWLEANSAPIIAIQCVRDPFAPYGNGTVIVPTTNEDVVDVSGAGIFIDQANALGVNNIYNMHTYNDPYTMRARSLYNQTIPYIFPAPNNMIDIKGSDGLFPMIRAINPINRLLNEGDPWTWWDSTQYTNVINFVYMGTVDPAPILANARAGNMDMSKTKALAYIDTIQGYIIPRIVKGLGLRASINDVKPSLVTIFPNPSNNDVFVQAKDANGLIESVEVIDLLGRTVRNITNIKSNQYQIERGNLAAGTYLIKAMIGNEQVIQKIVLE